MVVDESVPDREALRRTAVRRVRRIRWIGSLTVFAACLVPVVVVLLATPPEQRPGNLLVVLVLPALIGTTVLLCVLVFSRRHEREPHLVVGAERATRRAVRQALRTGSASDARIDALTREGAADALRSPWRLWLYVPVILLQTVVLVSHIIDGDGLGDIALSGAVAVTALFLLVSLLVNRRRSRRYLARPYA